MLFKKKLNVYNVFADCLKANFRGNQYQLFPQLVTRSINSLYYSDGATGKVPLLHHSYDKAAIIIIYCTDYYGEISLVYSLSFSLDVTEIEKQGFERLIR